MKKPSKKNIIMLIKSVIQYWAAVLLTRWIYQKIGFSNHLSTLNSWWIIPLIIISIAGLVITWIILSWAFDTPTKR